MFKERIISILLINKQGAVTEAIREMIPPKPAIKFINVNSFEKAKEILEDKHVDLIIVNSKISQKETCSFCRLTYKYYPKKTTLLLLTPDDNLKVLMKYMANGANCISPLPINKNQLTVLIHKHCGLIEREVVDKVTNGNITLYPSSKYLEYRSTRVLLSETDVLILEILLTGQKNCKVECLRKYVSSRRGEVTTAYIAVCISRLRKKIVNQTGLDIIKNKYGDGYYISI